ncbi:MAG TPA: hypothetical protein VFF72_01555 [Caldimonas sp.]|nr:hypothetical protein [Caldimonas sp.]
MRISPARVEVLVWVLVYGGLFVACLGFALQRDGHAEGWAVLGGGLAIALAGVVLIWVRARMNGHGERP